MSDDSTEQDRIEQDLKHTRARMDSRLFDLGERLTPGKIVDDLMVYFRGSEGGAFARNLLSGVSSNPMPAALTGIGLTWLMAANQRPNQASPAPADAGHADRAGRLHRAEQGVVRGTGESDALFRSRLDDARAQALDLTRDEDEGDASFTARVQAGVTAAGQAAAEARDKAWALVGQAGDKAKDAARGAGDAMAQGGQSAGSTIGSLASALGENPVLLGVLGLAAGALLGALVPQSESERQALDGMADSVRRKAGDAAQSVVDRGGDIAKQAVAAVREEAGEQGLTADTSVGDLVRGAQSGALLDGAKQVAASGLQAGGQAAKASPPAQPKT